MVNEFLTPDFPLPHRQQQLTAISEFLIATQPWLLVLGEKGTGKTSLLKQAGKQFARQLIVMEWPVAEQASPADLNYFLAQQLQLMINQTAGYREQLEEIIRKLSTLKQKALLIIDEAQDLPLSIMAALSHLALRQENTNVCLQVLLVGEPNLLQKIQQLQNRKPPCLWIQPLTRKETHEYVRDCVSKLNKGIGFSPEKEALENIYRQSGGLPPAIHQLTRTWLHQQTRIKQQALPTEVPATVVKEVSVPADRKVRWTSLTSLGILFFSFWLWHHDSFSSDKNTLTANKLQPSAVVQTQPIALGPNIVVESAGTANPVNPASSLSNWTMVLKNMFQQTVTNLAQLSQAPATTPAITPVHVISKNLPGKYTIQVAAASTEAKLKAAIAPYHLTHVQVEQRQLGFAKEYVAQVGSYQTQSIAQRECANLQHRWRAMHPWVRQLV